MPLPTTAPALTDGVVTLRRVRHGDEDALLDERLDPESRRWATSTRLWTAPDIRIFVAGAAAAWLAGMEARFAIVETATNTCVGSLGLRMTVPAFRIAEVGYGLRAGWRGRGLATRSVRLVADWAFPGPGSPGSSSERPWPTPPPAAWRSGPASSLKAWPGFGCRPRTAAGPTRPGSGCCRPADVAVR